MLWTLTEAQMEFREWESALRRLQSQPVPSDAAGLERWLQESAELLAAAPEGAADLVPDLLAAAKRFRDALRSASARGDLEVVSVITGTAVDGRGRLSAVQYRMRRPPEAGPHGADAAGPDPEPAT